MDAALTIALNLGLQLLAASACADILGLVARGSRRTRARLTWARRALRGPGWVGATAVTTVFLLHQRGVGTVVFEPVPGFLPGLVTAAGAAAASGIALVLAAGRTERRARLSAARRQVAIGGRIAFLGAAVQVVSWGTAFFLLPGDRQRELVAAGTLAGQAGFGVFLVGGGGFIALLAALTGKPRPSGPVGAVIYAGGYATLVAAAASLAKLIN